MTSTTIHQGDALTVLRTLPAESINCCITSPPYWGLRDYGVAGQLGLEPTPEEYVANMTAVFHEVRRVLRNDGTLWLNLGDSYVANGSGQVPQTKDHKGSRFPGPNRDGLTGLRPKNMVGIPWRVAFALQADGWYLRQDIIWHKPNPMPESVTDRCTKSHEYIFLLAKSEMYYYDAEAVAEDAESFGKTNGAACLRGAGHFRTSPGGPANRPGRNMQDIGRGETRNRRSVWTVPTQSRKLAHFATFPPDLIRPMIRAGCQAGGTVLDPFGGSGTTAMVAEQEGRNAVLIELNPAYIEMQRQRTAQGGLGI